MKNGFATRTRILLIRLGKVIPFLICAIVFISYCESFYAISTSDFMEFSDGVYLNKPISWAIAEYFRYDSPTLCLVAIISFAIQACKWNKLAIAYLAFQLYEKDYFNTHIYDNNVYYFVIAINIAITLFFVYMGGRLLFNK